jgi:glucose dehydrogenase
VTKTLLFVGGGGRGDLGESSEGSISVYDKATGEYLGAIPLQVRPNGNPMTYMHKGKQYIAITGGGGAFYGSKPAEPILMVLSLP